MSVITTNTGVEHLFPLNFTSPDKQGVQVVFYKGSEGEFNTGVDYFVGKKEPTTITVTQKPYGKKPSIIIEPINYVSRTTLESDISSHGEIKFFSEQYRLGQSIDFLWDPVLDRVFIPKGGLTMRTVEGVDVTGIPRHNKEYHIIRKEGRLFVRERDKQTP